MASGSGCNNLITSNLKKWGLQEHETCCMCDSNITDSIVHALTNCQWTVHAIKTLSKSIKCLDKIKQVDKTSFLFGVDDQSLNNIILVIKLMLHRFRQKKAQIQEDVFKKELYKRIISDKHAITQNKFERKWSKYAELVAEAEIYYKSINGEI